MGSGDSSVMLLNLSAGLVDVRPAERQTLQAVSLGGFVVLEMLELEVACLSGQGRLMRVVWGPLVARSLGACKLVL